MNRADCVDRINFIMPELTDPALECLVKRAESIRVIGRRDLSSTAEQRAREAEVGSQALTVEESKMRIRERATAAVAEPTKAKDPRPYQPKRGDWVQVKYNPRQDGGLHPDVCDVRKKYDGRAGIVGFAYGGESGPYYNRYAVEIGGREVWYHVSELSPLDPALHVSNGRGDVETCSRCHAVITDRFNGPCEPRPCDQVIREREAAPLYVDNGCDECGLVSKHAPTCSVKAMLDRKAIIAEVEAEISNWESSEWRPSNDLLDQEITDRAICAISRKSAVELASLAVLLVEGFDRAGAK